MAAGNATIGALRVSLGLDSAQFESGLKKAQGGLAGFGKLATVGFAAAATAAAAAGAAIAVGLKGAIDTADELNKVSQKVGVSVEALSRLKYAGELADVSLDQLSTGLKKLSVNMDAAAGDADGKAAAAFARLGISVTDANGALRSSDAVFADVAAAFGKMQDGATKTALATALFGKSGADLIPLLNAGEDGLAAMSAEAEALGVVIDGRTAQAAENFNDNLTRLKAVGQGLSNQLAVALAPALADVTGAFLSVARNGELMRGVGTALGATLKVLGSVAIALGNQFAAAGRGIAGTAKIIALAFKGDFAGAWEAYKTLLAENMRANMAAAKAIGDIWSGAGAKAAAAAPKLGPDLAAPMTEGAKRTTAARKSIEKDADRAVKALGEYVAAEEQRLAQRGLDENQVKIIELKQKAQEALNQGYEAEFQRLVALIDAYRQLGVEVESVADTQVEFLTAANENRPEWTSAFDDFAAAVEQVQDRFYQVSQAVDDVFYGLRNNDWVGALGGLVRAIQGVKAAWDSAASSADKASAVAAVGASVGNAVGGKAGATISGAASGAATGFAVAGPVGAVVGGILGGLGGFLGASKAKKRAKREAAERARQEAERKAAEEAAAKRALEIRLMELAGDAAAARAAREEDYLATLSPANQELAKQVLNLEREAEAREAANALVAQQRSLEAELAQAMGDSATALRILREDELAALPEALRPIKQAIYNAVDAAQAAEEWAQRQAVADEAAAAAHDTLAEAYERESGALEDTRERMLELADALAQVGRELRSGALAGLSPQRGAQASRAAVNALLARAEGGDQAALAQLPDAIREFVSTNRALAGNPKALNAVLAEGRAAAARAEALARGQVSVAQQQLDALRALAGPLVAIEAAAISVKDAVSGLTNALYAQQQVQAQAAQALGDLVTRLPAFDAAAVGRTLDSVAGAAATTPTPAAGMLPVTQVLEQIMINTGATATSLDDVTRGGDTIRITSAA